MNQVTDGTSHKNPRAVNFDFTCSGAQREGINERVVLNSPTTATPGQGHLDLAIDVPEKQFFTAGKTYRVTIVELGTEVA